jgi:hypothetical protein
MNFMLLSAGGLVHGRVRVHGLSWSGSVAERLQQPCCSVCVNTDLTSLGCNCKKQKFVYRNCICELHLLN